MSRSVHFIQAQRACVMQPRVRITLGIESPDVFISPNPNGVPSESDRSQSFTMSSNSRGMDATPLGLVVGIACGSSRYPGLFQPWAIIRKPVGLGLSPSPIADMNHFARLHLCQSAQNIRHQRQQHRNAIIARMKHDEADRKSRDMLLIDHVAINGDQRIEIQLCPAEQIAIFDPVPPHVLHRHDDMRQKLALQRSRQVLIKQQAHDRKRVLKRVQHPCRGAPALVRGSRMENHPRTSPSCLLRQDTPSECLSAHEFP